MSTSLLVQEVCCEHNYRRTLHLLLLDLPRGKAMKSMGDIERDRCAKAHAVSAIPTSLPSPELRNGHGIIWFQVSIDNHQQIFVITSTPTAHTWIWRPMLGLIVHGLSLSFHGSGCALLLLY
eukprot:1767762-Amphidinium_carterae.1